MWTIKLACKPNDGKFPTESLPKDNFNSSQNLNFILVQDLQSRPPFTHVIK